MDPQSQLVYTATAGKIIALIAPTRSGKSYLTERLAEHYKSPALYEYKFDANKIPQQVRDSLRNGGSIDGWLYFRNRHVEMQMEAFEVAKKNQLVFLDTSWITDWAYISYSNVDVFHEELLTSIHDLDTRTIPFPDIIILLTCDDATSQNLWLASGKEFEQEESYFAERLLPLKRQFEKCADSVPAQCRLIRIDRTGLDFNKSENLKIVTDKINAEIYQTIL